MESDDDNNDDSTQTPPEFKSEEEIIDCMRKYGLDPDMEFYEPERTNIPHFDDLFEIRMSISEEAIKTLSGEKLKEVTAYLGDITQSLYDNKDRLRYLCDIINTPYIDVGDYFYKILRPNDDSKTKKKVADVLQFPKKGELSSPHYG